MSGERQAIDFFDGMELAKKFPNLPIIFTSGLLPWSNIAMSEGEFLANFAIENFNIDESRIIKTDIVKNTFEEASEISRLKKYKKYFISNIVYSYAQSKINF